MRTFNVLSFRVLRTMTLVSSKNIGRWLLNHVKSLWTWLRPVFSTARTTETSSPDVASESDQNTSIPAPSESHEAIFHPNTTAEDGSPVSEAIPDSSSDLRRESSSKSSISSSPAAAVDEQSFSDSSDDSDMPSESEYEPVSQSKNKQRTN